MLRGNTGLPSTVSIKVLIQTNLIFITGHFSTYRRTIDHLGLARRPSSLSVVSTFIFFTFWFISSHF